MTGLGLSKPDYIKGSGLDILGHKTQIARERASSQPVPRGWRLAASNVLYRAAFYGNRDIRDKVTPAGIFSLAVEESANAAIELVAGKIGKLFATAIVEGDSGLLTPSVLVNMGRDMVIRGETLAYNAGGRGRVPMLVTARTGYVSGGPDPRSWSYQITERSPDGSGSRRGGAGSVTLAHKNVIHAVSDPVFDTPWRGCRAWDRVGVTAAVASALESATLDDASIPVKTIIPQPAGIQKSDVTQLKSDLRQPNGRIALPPTTKDGGGAGMSSAPGTDWKPNRIGPEMPAAQVKAVMEAHYRVIAALGMHPSYMDSRATAGALREIHRQVQVDMLDPMARILEEAASIYFDAKVTIRWPLRTDTMIAQARAAEGMVKIGADPNEAAAAAGIVGITFTKPEPKPAPVVEPEPATE